MGQLNYAIPPFARDVPILSRHVMIMKYRVVYGTVELRYSSFAWDVHSQALRPCRDMTCEQNVSCMEMSRTSRPLLLAPENNIIKNLRSAYAISTHQPLFS